MDCSKVITTVIDRAKDKFNTISQEIWKHPELNYREERAHNLLTKVLEDEGFTVQKNYFIDTAFRAEYSSSMGTTPVVCVICEYDALPEIGHACGHNLIAEAGIAAGIAIKEALKANPTLPGKVVVLGTPAEEKGGGKIDLIKAGAFKNIDIAMMVHPAKTNELVPIFISVYDVFVEYRGKAAHSAGSPWEGLNALDAAVTCYNSLSYLRQHIRPNCRLSAIITKGGTAANVIPERTEMEILFRAPSYAETERLQKKVFSCITSASEATGCEVSYNIRFGFEHIVTNQVVARLYKKHAESFGVKFDDGDASVIKFIASSDMGNVCHVVPGIHPIYNINTNAANHTKDFTDASGSPLAQEPTLIAAKSMALAALDMFQNPDLVKEAKDQFKVDMELDRKLT